MAATGTRGGTHWFTIMVYAIQFFFGGWFLAHGLNHFLEYFPRPTGSSPLSRELITALNHSGLFVIVKIIEIITGVMLLLNRWVPLAAVMAFPVSFSIAHLNFVANGDAFSIGVSICIIAFNGMIALGHLDKFLPMLVRDNGDPSAAGLRTRFGQHG
jgi:uncharacterized membrane protein YphA (DoxX/SURF4 family)